MPENVEETRLDGQADHIVVPAMHTQLMFSKKVFRQAEHFLLHGVFDRRSAAG